MPRYELSVDTSATGTGAPSLEIVAGAGKPMSLLELELANSAATAFQGILGRPGNTPAGATAQTATLPISRPPNGSASVGGLIASGWTTAPTIPAAGNNHRRLSYAAAIGNGGIHIWQPGEMVIDPTRSGSLILWNLAVVGFMRVRIKWDE